MWQKLGEGVLKYRFLLLTLLLILTIFLGWHASKVKLSYEFSKAIPADNPKYKAYQEFKKKFGEDGNLLVIGVQTPDFFKASFFNDYAQLYKSLKKINGVDDVISVPSAVNLQKDSSTEKLQPISIFGEGVLTQTAIDSSKNVFLNLPFYKGLLYNAETNAWVMGVRINRELLNSSARTKIINDITSEVKTPEE